MASENTERGSSSRDTKREKRTSWFRIGRHSSKKHYNVHSAKPTHLEPPDESLENKSNRQPEHSKDVPKLLEKHESSENVEILKETISSQRSIIENLVTENRDIKSKLQQIDTLTEENVQLRNNIMELEENKTFLELLKKDRAPESAANFNTNSDNSVVQTLVKELQDTKLENSKLEIVNRQLRYANESLQFSLDELRTSAISPESPRPAATGFNGNSSGGTSGVSTTSGDELSPVLNNRRDTSNTEPPLNGNGAVGLMDNQIYSDSNGDLEGPCHLTNGVSNSVINAPMRKVTVVTKVAGYLHNCELSILKRLKTSLKSENIDLKAEDWSEAFTDGKLTLVFCLNESRVGSDIQNALIDISDQAEIILVIMHHLPFNPNQTDPKSEQHINRTNICLTVDMFFFETDGLYHCDQNDRAFGRIKRLFEIIC